MAHENKVSLNVSFGHPDTNCYFGKKGNNQLTFVYFLLMYLIVVSYTTKVIKINFFLIFKTIPN